MKLPQVVYIYVDGEKGEEYLVASQNVGDQEEGMVGVYDFRETLNVRHVAELRRSGTKKWFKNMT